MISDFFGNHQRKRLEFLRQYGINNQLIIELLNQTDDIKIVQQLGALSAEMMLEEQNWKRISVLTEIEEALFIIKLSA
jgi:hypothetical protein